MKSLTLSKDNDMNIAEEKEEVIKQVEKVNDIELIRAIKGVLDFGLSKQQADEEMEASISRGLLQSQLGQTRSHEEVMKEIKEKYKL